jgi:SAM-dependent methyltransferase
VKGLKARWNQFANDRAGTADYFTLTSSHHSLTRVLLPTIEHYASGKILDLGAGFGAYRSVLEQCGDVYVGIDIQLHSAALDALADGRHPPFAEDTFDTVFCSKVLEHTPEPWQLLRQAHRLLAPGGRLILSAPHISYVHAAPQDYYRYTNYGLAFLLQQAGFEGVRIQPAGGVFSLLGSVPQSICLGLLPEKRTSLINAVLYFNRLLSHLFMVMDTTLDRGHLFALNFIAVARKSRD